MNINLNTPIKKCVYGKKNKYINVTNIIKNNLNKTIVINNKLFGKDPILNVVKELIIVADKKYIIPEKTSVIINYNVKHSINNYKYITTFIYDNDIKVTYNNIDVTNIIKNKVSFKVTKELFNLDVNCNLIIDDKYYCKYNDNIIIINKNKIGDINDFKNKHIQMFGKGPTFKDVEKKDIKICINQTANFVNDVDILAINDIHNIDRVNMDVIKKLKYIIMPEYLNVNQTFNKSGHWSYVYDKVKNIFNGKFILYNLANGNRHPSNEQLYNNDRRCYLTTANTCNYLLCNYFKIKQIDFYGIGVINQNNYKDGFIGNGTYDNVRLTRINKNLQTICKENKVKYNIY